MTESAQLRQRKRESLIIISFTIFSVFLAYVSVTQHWSAAMVPVLAAEAAFVWWAYVTGFQNYVTRAIIITLFASVSIAFYGIYGEHFNYLIPTLCVFTVLFGLYQLRPIVDIVFGTQMVLFLYHVFIKRTFILPEMGSMEADRMALQLLSLVILDVLVLYSVHRTAEIEEEVQDLDAQIDYVQKIKDDFVANTSHELRTPINTISGMSEILLQEDLPESAHRHALDIQMTGIELHTLVADIMDYAALEAGTLALNPRAYNITSTLNDVMNMSVFQNREKKLEVIFDCDPRIPSLLYGDEQQLRRIMNNLIGNAIKFTDAGGVKVDVTFRREEYGINLIVTVKDTGIGMSEESQEQIFQDFYQADSDRNRNVEGMGLGLTISNALIKKMGGFMTVRSQQGVGSEFSFSVPQKVMDDTPCIALTHPEAVRAIWFYNAEDKASLVHDDYIDHINHLAERLDVPMSRATSLVELKRRVQQSNFTHLFVGLDEYEQDSLCFDELSTQIASILILDRSQKVPAGNRMHVLYKPYNAMTLVEMFNGGDILLNPRKYQQERHFEAPDAKVLVVDDNVMNLKVVEGLLRKFHIKITAASSGEEALAQIESQDYDFVFMDHMMPGMDGIECFRRIRAKQGAYYHEVPIIALTANAIAGSREMFLDEGFNDFVAKPIDNAMLHHVLEAYIPDHKKTYVDEAVEEDELLAAEPDPFEQMEGIDMPTALAYVGGDVNDFVDLARVYCQASEQTRADIERCYGEKDWKNYAILVHSLKSTSKTLGALELSNLAFTEETAAKAEDEATIHEHHQEMLDEYERVLQVFRSNPKIFEEKKEPEKPRRRESLDITEWLSLYNDLQVLLKTYEADAVLDHIAKYEDRTHKGKDLRDLLAPMLAKLDEFDFDGALAELEALGGAR